MTNIDVHWFWFAFMLTVLAGLSTGIGSALALFTRTTNTKALPVALGFSAGVMIKAFLLPFSSGLAESVGVLIGYFLLRTVFSDTVSGILFGAVALWYLSPWMNCSPLHGNTGNTTCPFTG